MFPLYPRKSRRVSGLCENLRSRVKSLPLKVRRRRWPVPKERGRLPTRLSLSPFRLRIPSNVSLYDPLFLFPFVYLSLTLFLFTSLSLALFHSRIAWADARSCMSRMKTVPNAASSPDENQPLRGTSAFTSVPVVACDENACVVNNAHVPASLLFSFSLCSLSAISGRCLWARTGHMTVRKLDQVRRRLDSSSEPRRTSDIWWDIETRRVEGWESLRTFERINKMFRRNSVWVLTVKELYG